MDPRGQRGTSRARIASARARGERRRPVPAAGRGERLDLARLVPSGRSLLLAFAIARRRARRLARRARDGVFAVRDDRGRRRAAGGRDQVRQGTRADSRRRACSKVDLGAARAAVEALPTVAGGHASTARTRTPFASSSCPSARSPSCGRAPTRTSSPQRGRVIAAGRPPRAARARPDLGRRRTSSSARRDARDGRPADRGRRPSRRSPGSRFPGASSRSGDGRRADAPPPLRARAPARGRRRRRAEARRRGARAPAARADGTRYLDVSRARAAGRRDNPQLSGRG